MTSLNNKMEFLLVIVAAIHIVICPYTKVEESFNLQAMHDILYYGTNISQYDHVEFPGVVPRTFIGPIIVAFLSYPFVTVVNLFGCSKFIGQYIVRAVLGSLIIFTFSKYHQSLRKEFGYVFSNWFILITASQFHFMYYLSRPLPNTFALILALLSYHFWLRQNHLGLIVTSALVAVIFRAEVASLMAFIIISEIISKRLSIGFLLKCGISAGLVALSLTVIVDSYFWQRLLWPEGEVLWFNIVLNKSSEWGTAPWLWYFYSAVPRALCFSVLFVPLGLWVDHRVRTLLLPALGFVILYSFLPHKELRFIIYVFPLLNVAVARACTYLWHNRLKSLFRVYLVLLVCFHLVGNLFASGLLLYVSHYNYPGGYALARLHELETDQSDVHVHIGIYPSQTGISRFAQLNSQWRYDKTENLEPGDLEMMSFTHLIMEGHSADSNSFIPYQETHNILESIKAFSHFKVDYTSFPPLKVLTKPHILLLQKKPVLKNVIINSGIIS